MSLLRAALVPASLSFLAAAGPAGGDPSVLPIPPADVHAVLAPRVSLAKAIETAEKDTGGRARQSSYDDGGDVLVQLFTPTQRLLVRVDGTSGAIESKTDQTLKAPGAEPVGPLVQLPSGLAYYDLVAGTGETPSPTSTVSVHYTGWTNDGVEFDSSHRRGQPTSFRLDQVIRGWTEGVGSMKVGGKRKLLVPYELGYGAGGNPRAAIPPKAALIFDVELVEIGKKSR